MAKKSFINEIEKRHKDFEENLNKYEMEKETKEALIKLDENAKKEEIIRAKNKIKTDKLMSNEEKNQLMNSLIKSYNNMFNFDNCPEEYEALKEEAKFLSGMTQYSFLLMAQRLLKIRDNEMYKTDGYNDFKSFIKEEINIAQRTAYDYINIIECFGLRTFAIEEKIEYTKLLPAIPILKSENKKIPKEEIKKEFLKKAKIESVREIKEEAKEIKIKYGLAKEKKEIRLIDKIKNEIVKLNYKEKKELREYLNSI